MLSPRPVLASLAAIPFFGGLEPEALDRLAASMRSRRFRRGEVIFHVGDPGDALFVIVSGEVKISAAVRDRGRGDPGHAPSRRRLRGARSAGRRAALGQRHGAHADRDGHPAARPVPRAHRHGGGGSRRPAGLDRRRAPAPHDARRGAAFPRHHRAPRRPARAARPGRRDAARGRLAPAPDEPDPGGPRGDGRLHAPEREQAPGPVHGRRADPTRA